MIENTGPKFICVHLSKSSKWGSGPTMFNTNFIAYVRQDGYKSILGIKKSDGEVEEVLTDETIVYLKAQLFGLESFWERLSFLFGG